MRAIFIQEFIMKFYSNQVNLDALIKDAETAWAAIEGKTA